MPKTDPMIITADRSGGRSLSRRRLPQKGCVMWEFLLVAAIVIVVFGFSIRRQLRFFLGARREVAGRISEVEPFLEQDDNGSRWVTRCKVEYEVDGKLYQRRTMRRVQPALGEAVILTYPESRPDEAVEGHQQAAAKQQIFALVASLLALLFLFLFRAYQASLLPE